MSRRSGRRATVKRVLLLARRARGTITTVRALLRLVIRMRGQRPLEWWIGDSHAICFNMPITVAPWVAGREGQVMLHLGGRLMHSTATRGLPPQVHRTARLIRRFGRRGTVVPFLCAGEIDVRCHLVPRSETPEFDLDFVAGYVRRAAELAEEMGSARVVIVVPPPQSENVPQVARYPIRGTITQRVAMSRRLRDRMLAEAGGWPGPVQVMVLDATAVLEAADGAMRDDLTDDGVHTNDAGIALVRRLVRNLALGTQVSPERDRPGDPPSQFSNGTKP